MSYHTQRRKKIAKGSRGRKKRTKTPRISLHLPKGDADDLRKLAVLRQEPVSTLVREAVDIWLTRARKSNPFLVAE